jgi:predicted dehydrogenase
MTQAKLRTVLLGCGAIGEFHVASLQRLKDKYQVVGVADTNLASAQKVAEIFGVVPNDNGMQLLEQVRGEVALIALPHLLHLEYGLEAMKQGYHLLLEKPMAVSTIHCQQLIEQAALYKRKMLISHTHQFRPHFRHAARLIKEGAIGKLEMIFDDAAAYYDFENRSAWFLDPKISGGGALFNLIPHQIDHLLFFNDSPVVEVIAKLSNLYPDCKIDTDCCAMIRFANGVVANVTSSISNRLIEPGRIECRILGNKGSLLLPAFKPEVIFCHGNQREIIDCSNQTDPIDLEWLELHQAITDNFKFIANGEYGKKVVSILEKIRDANNKIDE